MNRAARAALTLTDDYATITLRPAVATAADPVMCKQWDLGAPEVRVTSAPRTGADGTDESDGFVGSRTVTFDLVILGDPATKVAGHDPYWYAEQLAAFSHPLRRPTLKISRPSETNIGQTWNLQLRGNPFSVAYGQRAAALLEMQLSFTAPLGLLESDLKTATTGAPSSSPTTDWHFPAAFPHTFGVGYASPTTSLTVGGTAPVAPIITISGPCTDPRIRDDAGNQWKFTGLTLLDTQAVQVNMDSGTVLRADAITGTINSDADVFHLVDFGVSTFWRWLPGDHSVSYVADSGSAVVQWRDRQMTI